MADGSDYSDGHWQVTLRVLALPNEPRFLAAAQDAFLACETKDAGVFRRDANTLATLIRAEREYILDWRSRNGWQPDDGVDLTGNANPLNDVMGLMATLVDRVERRGEVELDPEFDEDNEDFRPEDGGLDFNGIDPDADDGTPPPGDGGNPPGDGGNPPGDGGSPPGDGGNPPGQGGAPGAGDAPGAGGTGSDDGSRRGGAGGAGGANGGADDDSSDSGSDDDSEPDFDDSPYQQADLDTFRDDESVPESEPDFDDSPYEQVDLEEVFGSDATPEPDPNVGRPIPPLPDDGDDPNAGRPIPPLPDDEEADPNAGRPIPPLPDDGDDPNAGRPIPPLPDDEPGGDDGAKGPYVLPPKYGAFFDALREAKTEKERRQIAKEMQHHLLIRNECPPDMTLDEILAAADRAMAAPRRAAETEDAQDGDARPERYDMATMERFDRQQEEMERGEAPPDRFAMNTMERFDRERAEMDEISAFEVEDSEDGEAPHEFEVAPANVPAAYNRELDAMARALANFDMRRVRQIAEAILRAMKANGECPDDTTVEQIYAALEMAIREEEERQGAADGDGQRLSAEERGRRWGSIVVSELEMEEVESEAPPAPPEPDVSELVPGSEPGATQTEEQDGSETDSDPFPTGGEPPTGGTDDPFPDDSPTGVDLDPDADLDDISTLDGAEMETQSDPFPTGDPDPFPTRPADPFADDETQGSGTSDPFPDDGPSGVDLDDLDTDDDGSTDSGSDDDSESDDGTDPFPGDSRRGPDRKDPDGGAAGAAATPGESGGAPDGGEPTGPVTIPSRYRPHLEAMSKAKADGKKQAIIALAQDLMDKMQSRGECPPSATIRDVLAAATAAMPDAKPAPKAEATGAGALAGMDSAQLQKYVGKEVKAITGLLEQDAEAEAKSRAVMLSGNLRKASPDAYIPPDKILALAAKGVKGTAGASAEAEAGVEISLSHVQKTNWSNFAKVYNADAEEQESFKEVATLIAKTGRDSGASRSAAKAFITSQKKEKRKSFKFRNSQHLVDAVEQAIRMRATGQKLKKPLKPSDMGGEG